MEHPLPGRSLWRPREGVDDREDWARQTARVGLVSLRILAQAESRPQLRARLERMASQMRPLRLEPATAFLHPSLRMTARLCINVLHLPAIERQHFRGLTAG